VIKENNTAQDGPSPAGMTVIEFRVRCFIRRLAHRKAGAPVYRLAAGAGQPRRSSTTLLSFVASFVFQSNGPQTRGADWFFADAARAVENGITRHSLSRRCFPLRAKS